MFTIYWTVILISAVTEASWVGYGIWNLFQTFPAISLIVFLLVLGLIFVLFWVTIGFLCLVEWILFGKAVGWREAIGRS
jgi:hypothetical protein